MTFKQIDLQIQIKAFHPFYINRFVSLSQMEAQKINLSEMKNVFLPKKKEHFTVLRSPHVDKKARDQFERITHKRLLALKLPYQGPLTIKQLHQFLSFLQTIKVGVSLAYTLKLKN